MGSLPSMDRSLAPTAIVTGGAKGIGRGCALALAAKGFDIVLVDLLDDEMGRTRGEIEAMGRRCLTYRADVADFARAQEVAADVLARFGRIDFLLNNAGRAMPKGLLDITEEEWDRTIAINLKSCFNWCRAVVPAMQAQGAGRIASMSSINAHSGGVTSAVSKFAYAAAKRVAESDQVSFNPLFLYGGVGLGKTHLMHAIAWEIRQRTPHRRVIYLSAEKFMYSPNDDTYKISPS